MRGGIVAWFFIVRVIRFGDGLQQRYYNQRFNFYTDLPLVPELVRFTYASLSWWQFSLLAIGVVGLLFWLLHRPVIALSRLRGGLPEGSAKNTFSFSAPLPASLSSQRWQSVTRPENISDLYRTGFAARRDAAAGGYEVEFLRNVY